MLMRNMSASYITLYYQILDTIIIGEKGETGDQGPKGDPGMTKLVSLTLCIYYIIPYM